MNFLHLAWRIGLAAVALVCVVMFFSVFTLDSHGVTVLRPHPATSTDLH